MAYTPTHHLSPKMSERPASSYTLMAKLALSLLLIPSLATAATTVAPTSGWVMSNSTTLAPGCVMQQQNGTSDFLILLDASGSMCPYIKQITNRLNTFVTGLQKNQISDSRFAVAIYGGQPALLQPFTVSFFCFVLVVCA